MLRLAASFAKNDQANAGAETYEQASAALCGPLSDLMEITTTKSDGYLEQAKGNHSDFDYYFYDIEDHPYC